MRHSIASLPEVTCLGWVSAKSLKDGHIQKSTSGSVTIFFENGKYWVTGIPMVTASNLEGINPNYEFESIVSVGRDLSCAHTMFNRYARKYRYRTNSTTLPAEAIRI